MVLMSLQVDHLKGAVALPHVEGTLEEVRKRTALDLGAPRIPQVAWKDVGGLEHVKKAILETIELPLKYRCESVPCVLCVRHWLWHQLLTDKHVLIAAALRAVHAMGAVHVAAPYIWQAGHTRRVCHAESPPLPT